jgi:hypothetical protein
MTMEAQDNLSQITDEISLQICLIQPRLLVTLVLEKASACL